MRQAWSFPHMAWVGDAIMAEIERGLRRGTITDLRAFYARCRACTAAALAAMPSPAAETYLVAEEGDAVPGSSWLVSIGAEALPDEVLAARCEPYRLGLDLMRARAVRDYRAADSIRAVLASTYGAEVQITRRALRIVSVGAC